MTVTNFISDLFLPITMTNILVIFLVVSWGLFVFFTRRQNERLIAHVREIKTMMKKKK